MSTAVSGARLEQAENGVALILPPGTVAASSMEGVRTVRAIILHSVEEELLYRLGPSRYRRLVAERSGLDPDSTAVLMTAVEPSRFHVVVSEDAVVLVSVGLSSPACTYMERVYEPPPAATINVIVWTPHTLSTAGLMDLYRVAVEAKTAAASLLLPPCRSRPTGTVTDAVLVAAPVSEEGAPWAGMATRLGNHVARTVFDTVIDAGRPKTPREALERLTGTTLDELLDTIMRAYSEAPVPGQQPEAVRRLARTVLEKLAEDPNILLLLAAARELDHHLAAGSLPGTRRGDDTRDPRGIVADELLAAALAVYINGFRGLLATYWVDRTKTRLGAVLAGKPVFTDDALSALIGTVLSILYDRLAGGREWS